MPSHVPEPAMIVRCAIGIVTSLVPERLLTWRKEPVLLYEAPVALTPVSWTAPVRSTVPVEVVRLSGTGVLKVRPVEVSPVCPRIDPHTWYE